MFLKKKKGEPENLKEVGKTLGKLIKELDRISKRVSGLEKKTELIKRIGLKRYDAFSKSGGRQSFSVAILDQEGSGIVITSLYRDDVSRVFAKPISKGKSEYSLSEEEKDAIERSYGYYD